VGLFSESLGFNGLAVKIRDVLDDDQGQPFLCGFVPDGFGNRLLYTGLSIGKKTREKLWMKLRREGGWWATVKKWLKA